MSKESPVNDVYLDEDSPENINVLESTEQASVRKCFEALRFLGKNDHFAQYRDLISKEMERKKNNLVSIVGNDEEMHRIQGYIQGLKYALDIEYLTRHYQNKFESYGIKNQESESDSKSRRTG